MDDQVKRDILNAVDSLQDDLVQLVSGAVQIPSVNPTLEGVVSEEVIGGETRVNEFLKPAFESFGLATDLWEEEKGRANLVGCCNGTGGGRSLIFNGHIDVVPSGDESLWTVAPPWSGKVVDGRIYGRGTTDMKGGVVSAAIALKAFLKAGYRPKGDVFLEAVAGEEMMNTDIGTGATLNRGYRADAAIVAEPSSPPYRLAILTASPGVLLGQVTVKGKTAHASARDELIRAGGRGSAVAVSAMDKAMLIYQGLLKLEEEWGQTKTHPAFARSGHFTIGPVTINGGRGPAFIPDECRIGYIVYHAPNENRDQVINEINTHISRVAQTDSWLRDNPPVVDWGTFWWPPYNTPMEAPICQVAATAYEAVLGQAPNLNVSGFAAVDDASFLSAAGIPTITMGPGTSQVAHQANEYVEISDLIDAAKIFALTIAEWCGI